jgi:hypothetical protein
MVQKDRAIRGLLLAVALVLLSSIAWCDEYVLVMSKDDDVCLHMSQILNSDLKKHGEIRFKAHPEFTAIKWEQKRRYCINERKEREKDYDCLGTGTAFLSSFDINNDGKAETVVWSRDRGLHAISSDNIFVFKKEEAALFKDGIEDTQKTYKRAMFSLGMTSFEDAFRGNTYSLKEIPPVKVTPELGTGKTVKTYNFLGGWFYFNPFVYKGTYYVTMTDWVPLARKDWLVILQCTPDNQVKDVCYYLKAITTDKKPPEGR